jgi:AcrR family transcriptional regulator
MKRTTEDSLETRQLILDTARTLFARRGFDSTSTADIAERAALTRGALYHHFKNKEVLFQEIVLTYEAQWDTWYEQTVDVLPTAHSQLHTFFVGYLTKLLQDPTLQEYATILRQPSSGHTRDLITKINQTGEQFVVKQFTQWLKKAKVPKKTLDIHAHSLSALFMGLEHLIVTGVPIKERTIAEIWSLHDPVIATSNKIV